MGEGGEVYLPCALAAFTPVLANIHVFPLDFVLRNLLLIMLLIREIHVADDYPAFIGSPSHLLPIMCRES